MIMKKSKFLAISFASLLLVCCSKSLDFVVKKPNHQILKSNPPITSKYFSSSQEDVKLTSAYNTTYEMLKWDGARDPETGYKLYNTQTATGLTLTASVDELLDNYFSIDYQNYLTVDELSNSNGFLDIGFGNSGEDSFAEFDYYLVTLTDVIDVNSKLTYAVIPQPTSSGWWYEWTLCYVALTDNLVPWSYAKYQFNAGLKIAGTDQPCSAVANVFDPSHSMYVGPYDHVGFNIGLKKKEVFPEYKDNPVTSHMFRYSNGNAYINSELIANLYNKNYLDMSKEYLTGTRYEDLYTEKTVNNLFSSRYCTLNIKLCGLHTNSVSMHIKRIGNQTIGTSDSLEDTAPYMFIDAKTNAILNTPYLIPDITVKDFREGDISDDVEISFYDETGAYYPYSSGSPTITFTSSGRYTMEVEVELESGKVFSQQQIIKCFDETPKTEFILDAKFEDHYLTGDTINIPAVRAYNPLSLKPSNEVEGKVVVQCDGRTLETYDFSQSHYLTLKEGGTYIVGYLYINEYGKIENRAFKFTVGLSVGINPKFIPVSFASDKTNTLSDFDPINYVNETESKNIYRAIYINNEQVYLAKGKSVLAGSLKIIKTITSDTISLIYKSGFSSNSLVYEKEYVVPVIKATDNAEDYLVLKQDGQVNRSAFSNIETYTAELPLKFSDDSSVTLPQTLPFSKLSFKFDVKSEASQMEALEIRITDYYNASKELKFVLNRINNNSSQLVFNNELIGTIDGSFTNDDKDFYWYVDNVNNRMLDAYGTVLTGGRIKTWSDGSIFDGFTDGSVVLSFNAVGVTGEGSISIKNVCDQPFQTSIFGKFRDRNAPIIVLEEEYESKYALGDRIKTINATCYDVLSPETSMSLNIKDPNSVVKYNGDIAAKPKSFYAEELGKYTIGYYALDDSNNSSFIQNIIEVRDATPPVITVNGEIAKTATVGTSIVFPTATVKDDFSVNLEYELYVINPLGQTKMIVNKSAPYVLSQKGTYFVRYLAYDDFYNFAFVEFEIEVQ